MKKLFVGSLSFNTTEERLMQVFAEIGTVVSAKIIIDRATGRSKGFGFVEMESDEAADKAIAELNGKELDGRTIFVNEARPEGSNDRPKRFGNGGGGYGGGSHSDY